MTTDSLRLLDGLNPEQYRAVTFPNQNLLILAGAGTGKTRVLTTRIAWLLHEEKAEPQQILALTFTNKAAAEMRHRLEKMLGQRYPSMLIGTFHGICHRLLRIHHVAADLPQHFQILDQQDQLNVIKRILKQFQIDDKEYEPKKIQSLINKSKEQARRAADLPFSRATFDQYFSKIYSEYEKVMQRDGLVDFAELLLRCYELFEKNETIRERYRQQFSYLLVDEFQDTNQLEYALIKLLHQPDENYVFAVGDDDQSIYSFRGVQTNNMERFRTEFNIKTEALIRLEQNYRSHSAILNAANYLIQANKQRLGKNLWTDNHQKEKIVCHVALTEQEEARFVTEKIQLLHEKEQIAYQQVAILYRTNAQSRIPEQMLMAANIPYRVYGGMRFFDRQEIKHVFAYLRLLINPDDNAALLRVINFPVRGIGLRTIEGLTEQAETMQTSLFEAGLSFSHASVQKFVTLIQAMQKQCELLDLEKQIEMTIQMSGLLDYYQNHRDQSEKDRTENLHELVHAARDFKYQNVEDNSLSAFLAYSILESSLFAAREDETNAVQLMTVHNAKGLEFETVFIIGLEEGLFPHANSTRSGQKAIEEERRLMYVAITRARKKLFLCHAEQRFRLGAGSRFSEESQASRFLNELPSDVLDYTAYFGSAQKKYYRQGQWKNPEKLDNQALMQGYLQSLNRTVSLEPTVSPPPTPLASASEDGEAPLLTVRVNQRVQHKLFGIGTITKIVGEGEKAMISIDFQRHGQKTLAFKFAKLFPA